MDVKAAGFCIEIADDPDRARQETVQVAQQRGLAHAPAAVDQETRDSRSPA